MGVDSDMSIFNAKLLNKKIEVINELNIDRIESIIAKMEKVLGSLEKLSTKKLSEKAKAKLVLKINGEYYFQTKNLYNSAYDEIILLKGTPQACQVPYYLEIVRGLYNRIVFTLDETIFKFSHYPNAISDLMPYCRHRLKKQ